MSQVCSACGSFNASNIACAKHVLVEYVRPVRVLPTIEPAPAPMQAPPPAPIPSPAPAPVTLDNAVCVAEIVSEAAMGIPQPPSVYDSVISVMGLNVYPMKIDFGAGTPVQLFAVKLTRLSDRYAGYAYLTRAAVETKVIRSIRAAGQYTTEMIDAYKMPDVVIPTEIPSVTSTERTREEWYETIENLSRVSKLTFDVSVVRSMILAMQNFSKSPMGLSVIDYGFFLETVVAYINRYFVCINREGSRPYYLEEVLVKSYDSMNNTVDEVDFIRRDKIGLIQAYEKLQFIKPAPPSTDPTKKPKKQKPVIIFAVWIAHMDSRTRDRVVFDPRDQWVDNGTTFNTWRGFAITQADAEAYVDDAESYKPWYDHILNVWCDGNVEHARYCVAYFASMLQNPGIKIHHNISLYSLEGVGKGLPCEIFGAIMGSTHYFQTDNLERLLGNFTSKTSAQHMFVVLNEVVFVADHRMQSRIKALSTERKKDYTLKGVDSVEVENYANYLYATNNNRTLKIDPSNRRNVMLHCKGSHDEAYFKRLGAVPPIALAKFLYSFDISGVNFKQMPHTDYERMQKTISMESPHRWYAECLARKRFSANYPIPDEGSKNYPTGMFQRQYSEWYDLHGKEFPGAFKVPYIEDLVYEFSGATRSNSCFCREKPGPQEYGESKAEYELRASKTVQHRAIKLPCYQELVHKWKEFFRDPDFRVEYVPDIDMAHECEDADEPASKKQCL